MKSASSSRASIWSFTGPTFAKLWEIRLAAAVVIHGDMSKSSPRVFLTNSDKASVHAMEITRASVTYGSPIFKAVQQKRRKALYRALKKSPKSPEFAVGEGAERSHVGRSVGALL